MVRIEEVQDETEKLRQQGLATEKDDDDEWEAIDAGYRRRMCIIMPF